MKSKNVIIILVIVNIILIGMFCTSITTNLNIIKGKKIIKEMTETEYDSQITELNSAHEKYANYVQNCKKQIAEAITNQGVNTSVDSTIEVMSENIGKILNAKTEATATATQILTGQTAWVNGDKIVGTMSNNGELNWKPSNSTTYKVPEGYYSGGTLDSSDVYNTGYNVGYTEYGKNIEEGKRKIASAITDMGVTTLGTETLETMANNIRKIPTGASSIIKSGKFIVPYYDNITIEIPYEYNLIICIHNSFGFMSVFNRSAGRIWRVTVDGTGSEYFSNGGNIRSGIKNVSGNQLTVGDDGYYSGEWTYIIL